MGGAEIGEVPERGNRRKCQKEDGSRGDSLAPPNTTKNKIKTRQQGGKKKLTVLWVLKWTVPEEQGTRT